jgi:hypothetical protein
MRIGKCLMVAAITTLIAFSGSSVMAKGKGSGANKGKAKTCLAGASTMTLQNKAGKQKTTVAFKNGTACLNFLKHEKNLKVTTVGPGANTSLTTPTGKSSKHGNSMAAQLCPAKSSTTKAIYFRNAVNTVTGKSFANHGQCVSFFAKDHSLLIVTTP